jgi:uncharacterized protein
MVIRIGVISDTHLLQVSGDLKYIFETYLADKDVILHAGDIVSEEIIDFFEGRPLHAVFGNMDPFEVRHRLPAKSVVEAGGYRIGLIHGWGPSAGLEDRIADEFTDVDIVVYGHSHDAANHVRNGVLFFNPGTATGYAASGMHSIGILDLGDTVAGEIIPL